MDETTKTLLQEVQSSAANSLRVRSLGQPGRIRWPREVKDRVKSLLESKIRVEDIARTTPIPRATIFKWSKQWGLSRTRKKKPNGVFVPAVIKRSKPVTRKSRDSEKSREGSLTLRLDTLKATITGHVDEIASLITCLRGIS
jgi:hypothetical protein